MNKHTNLRHLFNIAGALFAIYAAVVLCEGIRGLLSMVNG